MTIFIRHGAPEYSILSEKGESRFLGDSFLANFLFFETESLKSPTLSQEWIFRETPTIDKMVYMVAVQGTRTMADKARVMQNFRRVTYLF